MRDIIYTRSFAYDPHRARSRIEGYSPYPFNVTTGDILSAVNGSCPSTHTCTDAPLCDS